MSEPDFKSMAVEVYKKLKTNIEEPLDEDAIGMGMTRGHVDEYNIAMLSGLMARAYDMGKKDK